jgi:hypothetical protein
LVRSGRSCGCWATATDSDVETSGYPCQACGDTERADVLEVYTDDRGFATEYKLVCSACAVPWLQKTPRHRT